MNITRLSLLLFNLAVGLALTSSQSLRAQDSAAEMARKLQDPLANI